MSSDVSAKLEAAWAAAQLYLRNRSAALCFEYAPDDIEGGSAVCVDVAGRLFIATAAHNFDRLDHGVNWSVFAANRSSNHRLKSRDGFPASLRRVSSQDSQGHRDITIPFGIYFTTVVDEACGANSGGLIILDYQRTGLDINGQLVEVEPHGMSGGGVWYSPREEAMPTNVWDPGRLKLLGLSKAYFRQRHQITSEPIHIWLTVLRDDLPDLKGIIDPLIEN